MSLIQRFVCSSTSEREARARRKHEIRFLTRRRFFGQRNIDGTPETRGPFPRMMPTQKTTGCGAARVQRGRKLSGKGGRCKLNSVAEEVITTGTCPVARCTVHAFALDHGKIFHVHTQPTQIFSLSRQEAWPLRDSNVSTRRGS